MRLQAPLRSLLNGRRSQRRKQQEKGREFSTSPGANDVDLQSSKSPPPLSGTQAPLNGTRWARIKKAFTPERIFTGVIALAAVSQFLVTRQQASVMEGQLHVMEGQLSQMKEDSEQTKTSAEAAKSMAGSMKTGLEQSKSAMEGSAVQSKAALDASIQIARNDQRAWVGPVTFLPGEFTVNSKQIYLIAGHEATFGVFVINSGKSPALELKALLNGKFMRKTEKFVPSYELDTAEAGNTSLAVLQPGMRVRMFTKVHGLTIEQIELLRRGDLIFYIFGHIKYRDIAHRPHFTNFCLRLRKDLAGIVSHDAYNEAN